MHNITIVIVIIIIIIINLRLNARSSLKPLFISICSIAQLLSA